MGYRIVGCIALLVMTSGCKRETDVTVSESPTALTFKAVRGGQPACVDDVAIYRADDQLNPLWSIGAPTGAKCRSEFRYGEAPAIAEFGAALRTEFRYGEAPAGFFASGAPAKLIAGQSYIVTMRGAGKVGQDEFTKRF